MRTHTHTHTHMNLKLVSASVLMFSLVDILQLLCMYTCNTYIGAPVHAYSSYYNNTVLVVMHYMHTVCTVYVCM